MSVLDYLKDYRVVKATLPLLDGNLMNLDGVGRVTEEPKFEVTFLPDQLNFEQLDLKQFCMVTFDVGGENKSLKSKIEAHLSPTKLLLEMLDSYTYIQKREYFRVDADLSVSYWLIDAENPQAKSVRTPVNISGGGIRIPVSEEISRGARVGLEIVFDAPQPAVVECIAEAVGTYVVAGGKQLALRYIDIDDEGQDAIIAYCLAEQRKQLRLKVKVLGNDA